MRTTTLIPLVTLAMHLHGQAGLLDNTFSGDGKATFAGTGDTYFTAVVIQPNGKVVAVGSTGTSNVDFLVVRFNSNGTLDTSFDGDGYATKGLPGEDRASCVALQGDGKILVGGYYTVGANRYMAIVRLNADGTPDTGFGLNGQNFIAFDQESPTYAEGLGIAVQADGRIVVCGSTGDATDQDADLALARFDADGSIDSGFGSEGKVTDDVGTVNNSGNVVAVDNNGRLVIAGNTGSGNQSCVVHRFLTDGVPDAAFNGGHFSFDIVSGADHALHGMVLQPNGSVLVAGSCGGQFGATMLNANGYWDGSFGAEGKVQLVSPENGAQGYALCKQADGKFLIAGTYEHSGAPSDLCLARMNGDGSIDASFGTNGWAYYDIEGLVDDGRGMALQSDGKVVVVGTDNSVPKKGSVIRVLNDVGIGMSEARTPALSVSAFPDPATDHISLRYTLRAQDRVSGRILDATGRPVRAVFAQAQRIPGTHTERVDLDGLACGGYLLELRTDQGVVRTPFIKQ